MKRRGKNLPGRDETENRVSREITSRLFGVAECKMRGRGLSGDTAGEGGNTLPKDFYAPSFSVT